MDKGRDTVFPHSQCFRAALYVIQGEAVKVWNSWIIPMIVFTNLLFVPTASVWIHDPATQYHEKVDNVPRGLAVFAHYTSKIGFIITQQVEKVFSLPDDLKYQKAGFMMASNLLAAAKTFKITNPDFNTNMKSFVGHCVAMDAAIGRKYTMGDLMHSDDIWGLVTAEPSPVRSIMWRQIKEEDGARGRSEIVTCKEAVRRFNALWAKEVDNTANLFGKKIFGKNGSINPKTQLLQYLPASFQVITDISKSAQDILKQQMMIYAVQDGLESKSTSLGNPSLASRRAYLQQKATYETIGGMVSQSLMTMKAVFEAIAYGCFLFIVPLTLLPMGWKYLANWVFLLLWLQMWAPLYAILNYCATFAAKYATSKVIVANGVTIASSLGLADYNADIAAVAGYLAMSVPYLSFVIVKGVGSFVHLASHLGNISQGAASSAAGEAVSGNYSFGNISEGNTSVGGVQILQQSHMASYKGSGLSLQDGRTDITTFADGSYTANIGTSHLPVGVNAAYAKSNQLTEAMNHSQQNAFACSESSAQHLASAYKQMVDLSKAIGQSQQGSENYGKTIDSEQSQAINKSAELVERFAKENSIDDSKSAKLLANASVGIGSKGFISGSGSLSGGTSVNSSDRDLLQKAEQFNQNSNFSSVMREGFKASKSLSETLSDESSKRLAESTAGSYEKGESMRLEANKSFRQAEDYSRQIQEVQSNSASINANYNDKFIDWLAKQPEDTSPTGKSHAMGRRGALYIASHKPEVAMNYAKRFMDENHLSSNFVITGGFNPSSVKANYDSTTAHQVCMPHQDHIQQVKEQGNKEIQSTPTRNLKQEVEHDIQSTQKTIQQEYKPVSQKGERVKQEVLNEQGGSVTARAAKKAWNETTNYSKNEEK